MGASSDPTGGSAPLKARTVEVVSRAVDLARAMRQKNQTDLNSGTERRVNPKPPSSKRLKQARRTSDLNARRSQDRRWKP